MALFKLMSRDDEGRALLVLVEVPRVCAEAGTTGEDSSAQTAREQHVVDVLRLQVVLQVGGLGRFVGAQADSALDSRDTLQVYPGYHTFQHSLILLLAWK